MLDNPYDLLGRDDHEFRAKAKERAILTHIFHLYCIEMLRYAQDSVVSYQLAYQYGKQYHTPWSGNEVLTTKFMNSNTALIRNFGHRKLYQIYAELIKGIPELLSDYFTPLPLTPAENESICRNLEDVYDREGGSLDFKEAFYQITKLMEIKPEWNVRQTHADFMGLEVTDRLLCGVWGTMDPKGYMDAEAHPKDKSCACHQFVRDNKTFQCIVYLAKRYLFQHAEGLTSNPESWNKALIQCSVIPTSTQGWGLLASLMSIIYRTVYPRAMHPMGLSRLYDTYVLNSHGAAEAVAYARDLSGITIEEAAGENLPEIDLGYLCNYNGRPQTKFNAIYPDSLVEKYLVTKYLLKSKKPDLYH